MSYYRVRNTPRLPGANLHRTHHLDERARDRIATSCVPRARAYVPPPPTPRHYGDSSDPQVPRYPWPAHTPRAWMRVIWLSEGVSWA